MAASTIKAGSTETDAAAAATRLCLSCGICCGGLLHGRAVLKPEELPRARSQGLKIIEGELAFRLPCPRFDGCCTIYRDRPRGCERFRCALLRRLDGGEVSLDEGLRIVGEARRLIGEAELEVGAEKLPDEFRSFLQGASAEIEAGRKLQLTALAHYLDKQFVLSGDGYFCSSSPVVARQE